MYMYHIDTSVHIHIRKHLQKHEHKHILVVVTMAVVRPMRSNLFLGGLSVLNFQGAGGGARTKLSSPNRQGGGGGAVVGVQNAQQKDRVQVTASIPKATKKLSAECCREAGAESHLEVRATTVFDAAQATCCLAGLVHINMSCHTPSGVADRTFEQRMRIFHRRWHIPLLLQCQQTQVTY